VTAFLGAPPVRWYLAKTGVFCKQNLASSTSVHRTALRVKTAALGHGELPTYALLRRFAFTWSEDFGWFPGTRGV